MYKIGIIGHTPEHFSVVSPEEIQNMIKQTVELLSYQYSNADNGPWDLTFNMVCRPGIGLWAADVVRAKALNYHLFLPFSYDIISKDWLDSQVELGNTCVQKAYSMTVCNMPKAFSYQSPEQKIIDDSNFTICYWVGKKQGVTYNALSYALRHNKMILDGFHDLKMITKKDWER